MRTPTTIAAVVALAFLPSHPEAAAPGGVRGKVVVVDDGKRVDPKTLVDGDEVHVYLEPTRRRRRERAPSVTRTIRHKGLQFLPHISVVPIDTTIEFPNDDNEPHNAFSPSTSGNFDLEKYGPGARKRHPFDRAGQMEVFCDIHKDMWAIVKVVDSDWIAKVEPDGTFALRDVRPGEYRLVAWTRYSVEARSDPFTVGDDMVTLEVAPRIQRGPMKLTHLRKDNTEYDLYKR